MNRRLFLGSLIAAAAGIALDPERALWAPGKKLISIPAMRPVVLRFGDIITFADTFEVNPRTGKAAVYIDPKTCLPIRLPKRFIVLRECRSGDGLTCFPAPILDVPYRNVSKLPQGNPVLLYPFVGSREI